MQDLQGISRTTMHMVAAVCATVFIGSTVEGAPVLTQSVTNNGRTTAGGVQINLQTFNVSAPETGPIDFLTLSNSGVQTHLAGAERTIGFTTSGGSYNNSESQYFNRLTWTDGTPAATGSNVRTGWQYALTSGTVSPTFTVDNIMGTADNTWTIAIFGYRNFSSDTFSAQILDQNDVPIAGGTLTGSVSTSLGTNAAFTHTFNFARDPSVSGPQKLRVTYSVSGSTSGSFQRFGFNGASLTGVVPEPASLSLFALSGLMLLPRRR